MYIIHRKTGEKIRAAISKLESKEYAQINRSKRFNFNWNTEKKFDVYKLKAVGIDQILGLISLEDRKTDHALQIRLLASSKENIGEDKQYERIPGCLIAFACKKAFLAGYEGYVCLKPKTNLEKHYKHFYSLKSTKMFLITEGRNSLELIEKYYENESE